MEQPITLTVSATFTINSGTNPNDTYDSKEAREAFIHQHMVDQIVNGAAPNFVDTGVSVSATVTSANVGTTNVNRPE